MKKRALAATAALAIAAGGFAFGRGTAPDTDGCLAALGAADATTAVLAAPALDDAERVSRFTEIDYSTHRAACEEDAR